MKRWLVYFGFALLALFLSGGASFASCSYKPEACDNKNLCLYATDGKDWSSHGQYKRHVVEAKSRGLSCGIDVYDALSSLSFQELLGEIDTLVDIDLSASIQNQMIRLGCLKSDQRNNYDGTKSFNSLEYIFNFDQSLERSFVSYDNINFLFYLQSKENNYCRRTVTVFWDEDYSRAVFARFMNFVRLGINSDIRFEYQDPPLLYDFETPIAWETPTLKETDYIIKIKIEKKEGSGFDAKMRVYDVSTKKEIKKGLIFSTPKISNESMRAVSEKIVDDFLQKMTARQVNFKNLDNFENLDQAKFLDDEHLLLVEKIKKDISRGNLESAIIKLDKLRNSTEAEKIETEVVAELSLLLGKKYSELGETKKAARTFLNVYSTFENSIYRAEALLLLGNSFNTMGQTDAACKTLLQVQLRFPDSDYNIDATKMMTELKCP